MCFGCKNRILYETDKSGTFYSYPKRNEQYSKIVFEKIKSELGTRRIFYLRPN